MQSLNIVLSNAVLEEKMEALRKLQAYSQLLEMNNRLMEAQAINNIRLELKKFRVWELK